MPISFSSLRDRFIRGRTQRRRSVYDKPARERHPVSFSCSILTVLTVVTGLSLPQWATSNSSKCNCVFGLTEVRCINPHTTAGNCDSLAMTQYYKTSHEILISCMLSISVLIIISSLIGAVISCGYPREKLEFIRHLSIFNIVSMLCVVLVGGFWLAVCETLPIDGKTKSQAAYRDTVRFGYAYYIYMSSAVFALIATSFNLIRARSAAERRRHHRRHYRQRFMPAPRAVLPPRTLSQRPRLPQTREQQEESPPEYTEIATTSFIENFSDTDRLIEPPPYVP